MQFQGLACGGSMACGGGVVGLVAEALPGGGQNSLMVTVSRLVVTSVTTTLAQRTVISGCQSGSPSSSPAPPPLPQRCGSEEKSFWQRSRP